MSEHPLLPAELLAAALVNADEMAIAELLVWDATLLSAASGSADVPASGRSEVTAMLMELATARLPTRIRVLRSAPVSAVLSAYAGDDALWSIELQMALGRIDCVMVWLPRGVRARIAQT